jgi:chaperonin GroEL (HSP60 family)
MNENESNTSAVVHNIRAAKRAVNTVKTTLGPMGMDKMMVDATGSVIVTNDGATILQELDISHPAAKMVVEAANTQESMCYDGTTSTVVLAGELLGNSELLFNKGLHANIICRGYRKASKWATEHIEATLTIPAEEHLAMVAKTSITGKALESSVEHVSQLCVDAVKTAGGEYERIRVLCQPGGSLDDSSCFSGVVLHKEFMLPAMPTNPTGKALLINTGLSDSKSDDNVQLNLASAAEYQQYRRQSSRDQWLEKSQVIINLLPDGGVVFCRDTVNEVVAATLAKQGISLVHRIPESDMTALSKLLGTSVSHSTDDLTEAVDCDVECKQIGDMKYVVVRGGGEVTTLILRGATKQTLDETERGFEDALGVVCLAYTNNQVVAGGGSAYLNAALYLRSRAAEAGGREQMAIEAFADALESIPATIAENAGHDPLDTILTLRNEHMAGHTDAGPDIENGGACYMLQCDVYEPVDLVKQAIQSASEVTISILRIDDIIGKRGE